jgi:putative flippase GtrA
MIKRVRLERDRAAEIYRELGLAELFRRLVVYRTQNGLLQMLRYLVVGAVAAVVDTGVLLLLTHVLHVEVLTAGTISFALGTIVNYVLSVLWVFSRTAYPYVEMALFVLIGAAGLIVNDVVLWVCTQLLDMDVLWSKLVAIVVGFAWNFVLRKIMFDRLGARMRRAADDRARALDRDAEPAA